MKFYPIHMHLHCSHEPTASIGSHMSNALKLGIRHIWTTEHDTRMGKKKADIPVFVFPEEKLYSVLPNGAKAGFIESESNNGSYAFETTDTGIQLRITAKQGERESFTFHSQGKKHCDALFSRLSVQMDADIRGKVYVEFILSAQPPTYTQAKMRYAIGVSTQKEENTQYLPLPSKENGVYNFPLYTDVSEEIGGLDNALCSIRITVQDGGEMMFRSFRFIRERNFEQVRTEQKKIAKKVGEKWGVTAFVGFEVTGAGNHKNCFSTKVPVMDYATLNYEVDNESAIAHIKQHGGIFSWNHPYTGYRTELPKDEIKQTLAKELIENRVYGASLIEVGFPCGRDGFDASDYTWLWDQLSQNGVFITGDGDSDNHHAVADGWIKGNNFCSFAGLDDADEPTEENFVKAFSRGSVWLGDPVLMQSVDFSSDGFPMGSIRVGKRIPLRFFAKSNAKDGYAVCVINGKRSKTIPLKDGEVEYAFSLFATEKYNFARMEVYNADNRLIALTNPVYLVEDRKDLPEDKKDRVREMRIFETRHGQVMPAVCYNNDASRPVGDTPLSELGDRQALQAGKRLKELGFNGVIFASPYDRTLRTANIIAEELDLPFTPLPCLHEIFVQSNPDNLFKGLTADEIVARYNRARVTADMPYPWWEEKTEDLSDVIERLRNGLQPVLSNLPKDIDVLLVGHAATSVGMRHLFGCVNDNRAFHWNCHLSLLYSSNGEKYANDCAHLPEDMRTGNAINYLKNKAELENSIAQIKAFLARNKGEKVLHISDTQSSHYAYYKRLIDEIQPEVIVHTGDLVDELKAGRIESVRPYWLQSAPVIIDIMKKSGARVLVVAGNNDLEEELAKFANGVEILQRNTVVDLYGVRYCLCHELNRMDENALADAWLYGHGLTGETRTADDNLRDGKRFFNGIWGASLHIPKTGESVIIPLINI